MGHHASAVALLLFLSACSVAAEPFEVDVAVTSAGPAAPVVAGEACTLRFQPAWRQGVNCQLILRCGDEDLFGGARVGGYADCSAEHDALTRAFDGVVGGDGDPAIDVDVAARTIAWRDTADGTDVTLAWAGEPRPTAPW